MHINDLPVEILVKIFSYLPDLNSIFPVNWRFYDVASDLGDRTIWLNLDSKSKNKRKNIIESVMKTTRKITNINIDGAEREDVISIINIVKKFSTSVVDFKLNGGGRFEVTRPEFIDILSSIPNVINLSLVRVHFMGPKGTELLPSYEDLNLNQLKMLSIEYCSDEIVSTFNRLPAGLLSELKFRGDYVHQLDDLFKNQIGIKKLIVELEVDWRSPNINKNLFDDLQLESFEWEASTFFDGFYNIKTLLSKQTKLKSLKLKGGKVGEDSIDFITNQFTEVESLSMLISETDLKQIGKLKNLKELKLISNGDSWTPYVSTLETLSAGLDNSRITTLHINSMYYITPTQIAALAKSLPNLKFLHYDDYFDRVVQAIMENFTFVEGLEISCGVDPIDYQQFIRGNYVNPKLRQLELNCNIPIDTRILKKLITDYPNLKKLTIKTDMSISCTVAHVKQILEGFSKMESLCLSAGFNALDIKNVFKLLKLHKNIKFIAFGSTRVPIRDYAKLRKDLVNMNMFDVVEFSSSTNWTEASVQMAVGKNTFESEKVVFIV